MASTGNYESIYNEYHTNLMDASATRSNNLAEPIPVAGSVASFLSAINNIQVIVSGFEQ